MLLFFLLHLRRTALHQSYTFPWKKGWLQLRSPGQDQFTPVEKQVLFPNKQTTSTEGGKEAAQKRKYCKHTVSSKSLPVNLLFFAPCKAHNTNPLKCYSVRKKQHLLPHRWFPDFSRFTGGLTIPLLSTSLTSMKPSTYYFSFPWALKVRRYITKMQFACKQAQKG